MPFAEDFDAAAVELDEAAGAATALVAPVQAALGAGVMVGGTLTALVTDELDAARAMLDEVATELTRLADECRQRAEVSRQAVASQLGYDTAYAAYRTDLGQWRASHDGGGDATPPPRPPDPPPAAPPWFGR